jgi:hypothetical protein
MRLFAPCTFWSASSKRHRSCFGNPVKRKPARIDHPVLADAIRSLAVAVAVVVLVHVVFWIAGYGNTGADELDPPQSILGSD